MADHTPRAVGTGLKAVAARRYKARKAAEEAAKRIEEATKRAKTTSAMANIASASKA